MTPTEYSALLARLGLTHAEAGEIVGVTERASQHWTGGTREIPPAVAKLLRLIDRGHVTIDQVRRA